MFFVKPLMALESGALIGELMISDVNESVFGGNMLTSTQLYPILSQSIDLTKQVLQHLKFLGQEWLLCYLIVYSRINM